VEHPAIFDRNRRLRNGTR